MALLLRSLALVLALLGTWTEATRFPGRFSTFPGRRWQHLGFPRGTYSLPKPPSRRYLRPDLPRSGYSPLDPPRSGYSLPGPPRSLYTAPWRFRGPHSAPTSPRDRSTLHAVPGQSRPLPGGPSDVSGFGTSQVGGTQSAQTSATNEQKSSGTGRQTNRGTADGVSLQRQEFGPGGNTQIANNKAVIEALQGVGGGGGGSVGQTSNNKVNIESTQLQQNVEGTLININDGNEGTVIINTRDRKGAVVNRLPVTGGPSGQPPGSTSCRYTCLRPASSGGDRYCCDDGTNQDRGPPSVHGGRCSSVRLPCLRNTFSLSCAHDGQCADSDKCCYDTCAERHICKLADAE